MLCKCGGTSKPTSSANTKLKAVYEYYQCGSCQRCSPSVLTIADVEVARGTEAQRHYLALDKDLAKRLSTAATLTVVEKSPPLPLQEIAQFETGSLF